MKIIKTYLQSKSFSRVRYLKKNPNYENPLLNTY